MLSLFLLYVVWSVFSFFLFFFFKQKTAYEMRISDWSSDVCSSDLRSPSPVACVHPAAQRASQCCAGDGGHDAPCDGFASFAPCRAGPCVGKGHAKRSAGRRPPRQ